MSDGAPIPEDVEISKIELILAGRPLRLSVTVPTAPIRAVSLLRLAFSFTDVIVEQAQQVSLAGGQSVTCRKGCGVCCRQLVPISHLEAWHIRDVIESMPSDRRAVIQSRFRDAARRLLESGLLDKLQRPEAITDTQAREIGLAYFRLGIDCPFLEERACSIYPQRPVKCREYLVTSPAAACAEPSLDTVRCVELAGKISQRLFHADASPDAPFGGWVALILAPAWADLHADPPLRPGPELLRELMTTLAGKPAPAK